MNGDDFKSCPRYGEQPAMFNKNSYISVGLAVMMILGTLWIKNGQSDSRALAESALNELQHYKEMQKISTEAILTSISTLNENYKVSTTDRYTGHDHQIFVDRLRELNPALHVPK